MSPLVSVVFSEVTGFSSERVRCTKLFCLLDKFSYEKKSDELVAYLMSLIDKIMKFN